VATYLLSCGHHLDYDGAAYPGDEVHCPECWRESEVVMQETRTGSSTFEEERARRQRERSTSSSFLRDLFDKMGAPPGSDEERVDPLTDEEERARSTRTRYTDEHVDYLIKEMDAADLGGKVGHVKFLQRTAGATTAAQYAMRLLKMEDDPSIKERLDREAARLREEARKSAPWYARGHGRFNEVPFDEEAADIFDGPTVHTTSGTWTGRTYRTRFPWGAPPPPPPKAEPETTKPGDPPRPPPPRRIVVGPALVHYDTLGVSRMSSPAEVRAGWRVAISKCHPDRGGDPDQAKAINAAYDALKKLGLAE
jgi:hypothetical protein